MIRHPHKLQQWKDSEAWQRLVQGHDTLLRCEWCKRQGTALPFSGNQLVDITSQHVSEFPWGPCATLPAETWCIPAYVRAGYRPDLAERYARDEFLRGWRSLMAE